MMASTNIRILRLQKTGEQNRFFRVALILSVIVLLTTCVYSSDEASDLTPAPGNYRILSDDGVISFPFELFRGDIRFRGEINGREIHLLLDDGFMWDPLLFWAAPVDSLGFDYDGETSIGGGSSNEDAVASRTASGITLSFPGVEFTDQTAVITSYSSGVSNMWWGSEGQVSGTFLKHFVVDINFDDMMITLIEPDKFEYQGQGVEIPWKPLGFGPWAIPGTLELADGRSMSLELMMDLGYNDQLEISTTGENSLTVPEQALPAGLGFNIQGIETLGHIGRVQEINIGGYKISDVLASFVSGEHSDNTFHEVMIGLGLLSRFNLVFDYSKERMFIEPNQTFDEAYEYNMSGFSMREGLGGSYRITRIYDNSPASEAGLQVGDLITRINGKKATDFDIWTLRPLLRQEGKTVTFLILREGRKEEVSITLRQLI